MDGKVYYETEMDGYTARWVGLVLDDGREHPDRWLKIYEVHADGKEYELDDYSGPGKTISTQFCEERVRQLQEEYRHSDVVATDYLKLAMDIITRAWNKEWMGHKMGYSFFPSHVARILDVPENIALTLTDTLHARKFLGYNGLIIVPFEAEEEDFRRAEEATGHKKLRTSDMGTWWCEYCRAHGDEWGPYASEVPCRD